MFESGIEGQTTNALLELTNSMNPNNSPRIPGRLVKCASSDITTSSISTRYPSDGVEFDEPLASPSNISVSSKSSNGRTGRFSSEERKILVSVIWDDIDVLSAFCHQQRKHNIQGKSFMHLITDRFNEKTMRKRSHDAVRHHLKLRRSNLGPAMEKSPQVTQIERDFRMLEKLLEHKWVCSDEDTCTRCLQMHRLRVQRGLASCGKQSCISCDPGLPGVKEPFNARELLMDVRRRFYSKILVGQHSERGSTKLRSQNLSSSGDGACSNMQVPSSPCGYRGKTGHQRGSGHSFSSSTLRSCSNNPYFPQSPSFGQDAENQSFATNQSFEPVHYHYHHQQQQQNNGYHLPQQGQICNERRSTRKVSPAYSSGTTALANLLNFTKSDGYAEEDDPGQYSFRSDQNLPTKRFSSYQHLQHGEEEYLESANARLDSQFRTQRGGVSSSSHRRPTPSHNVLSRKDQHLHKVRLAGMASPTNSNGFSARQNHFRQTGYVSESPPASPVSPASVLGINVDEWFSPSNKRTYHDFSGSTQESQPHSATQYARGDIGPQHILKQQRLS